MSKKFFTTDEDYNKIIEKALKEEYGDTIIKNISLNPTGWTNIVYEVSTNQGDFFFRFPRDQFWERTIVKDYQFAKYIKGKTNFRTVELILKENEGRPFSIHKKIHGTPLAEKMNDLSDEDVKKVCSQIAKFMHEMHSLDYNPDEIFSIDNIGLNLQDFITELLSLHVSDEDIRFWSKDNFKIASDDYCLVHGDLNSSNVLLDDNNNVTAIIDFGFGGFGNKYFDISRIIGRCPENYKSEIVNSYEQFERADLNKEEVDRNIKIWSNIDNGYINYMRSVKII
jgi:aminoglycoside phosphotransferase (APT) family kinase protein